jgi:SAM-dependent methyltransferase
MNSITKKIDRIQQVQNAHWLNQTHARRGPDHPVVRAVFEPLADMVAASIDHPKKSSVLDVGCGNGYLQRALEHRFGLAAGLDYSQHMIDVNPCREKHLGSCTNLPFPDNSYDVAVAANLLHHLTEPDRMLTLAEMGRVAKSAIISFEPNRNNPILFALSLIRPEERMVLNFTFRYMQHLFEHAGFVGVQVHVKGWILPTKAPVWWIPVGRALDRAFLRMFGVDICTVGRIQP